MCTTPARIVCPPTNQRIQYITFKWQGGENLIRFKNYVFPMFNGQNAFWAPLAAERAFQHNRDRIYCGKYLNLRPEGVQRYLCIKGNFRWYVGVCFQKMHILSARLRSGFTNARGLSKEIDYSAKSSKHQLELQAYGAPNFQGHLKHIGLTSARGLLGSSQCARFHNVCVACV